MHETLDPEFSLSSDEVVEKFKPGIEAALHEAGLDVPDTEASGFSDKNIKIQKLTYRIIEKFEFPVIRTWYRYGQFEPYGTLRPKFIDPGPLTDPHTEIPARGLGHVDQLAIKNFLLESNLEKEWKMPLFEFLEKNYKEYAQDKFQDIYLAHLSLLETLEKIENDSEIGQNAHRYVDEIKSGAIDLWYEMDNSIYFEESEVRTVRDFFDTLQVALVTLSTVDNPKGPQVMGVRKASRLYHEFIWPLPAMEISVKEAMGPTDELENFCHQGREYIQHWSKTQPRFYQNWRDEIVELELTSSPIKYQSARERVPKAIGRIDRATLKTGLNEK